MQLARPLSLAALASVFSLLLGVTNAGVLVVSKTAGPGVDATTLQGAINMAFDGDTILVRDGRYSNVTIRGKGLRIVADGDADALVSAGNTGATILASAQRFQRLPGIRRAALAAVYPTEQRHGPKKDPFALMLDVGATLTAEEIDLVGFAVMGAAYSSIISEIVAPRVALLSNGTEPNKGTPAIKGAHQRLLGGPLNFVGNVDGFVLRRVS